MSLRIYWNRGNKSVLLNPIISGADLQKGTDTIGTLTLTIDSERLENIDFELGDNLIIPEASDNTKKFFRGRIFKISYENKDTVEITAYDLLKYFQGTKYYVFPTIDYPSRLKVMCSDLAIQYGYLEPTPNIPAELYTDKSYGDIMQASEDYLLYTNGKRFVHRVEDDRIVIRDLAKLNTNYIINDRITNNYSYSESAEDLVNVVEITQQNEDTNEYNKYVVGNRELMDRYGVLSMTEEDNDNLSFELLAEKAKNLLYINSQVEYELSFTLIGLANLQVYDVISVDINNQNNFGYIDNITWNFIDETTEITLSLLGK